jgi:hypothetical protein
MEQYQLNISKILGSEVVPITQPRFGQLPPYNGGQSVASGEYDDYIKEIGDQIASLSDDEAREVLEYIAEQHKVEYEL